MKINIRTISFTVIIIICIIAVILALYMLIIGNKTQEDEGQSAITITQENEQLARKFCTTI